MTRRLLLFAAAFLVPAAVAAGQSTPKDYRDEFSEHFERSTRKLVELSREMPARLYLWSPGGDAMTVARVYGHIARYNYLYLSQSMGVAAPRGVDWQNLETLTDKAQVVDALDRSIEHVRASVRAMTETDLTKPVMLYGRRVAGWAVLFQLLAHMNEHVGQAVAYARMNDIVPPWSR